MSPADGEQQQRILIVDDEPAVREALHRSLAFEGYGTEVAVDGADALDKAAAYRPDLVVLDIQMPRMDGLTAARRLRATGSPTPILMLTARDTVGDRVTGLDAGADDYLVKPFELDELFARIRALLRRSSYAPPPGRRAKATPRLRRSADGPGTREVTRGARTVELTRTEFTLLEMFLAHPRQVLTREQILKAVWGFDFEPSSNSLDVYVMYLRRKTEAGGEPRLVHTVRGVGYVLRPAGGGASERDRTAVSCDAAPLAAGDAGGDAVAVAVAAAAVACWFVVRGALMDSLDDALGTNRSPPRRWQARSTWRGAAGARASVTGRPGSVQPDDPGGRPERRNCVTSAAVGRGHRRGHRRGRPGRVRRRSTTRRRRTARSTGCYTYPLEGTPSCRSRSPWRARSARWTTPSTTSP